MYTCSDLKLLCDSSVSAWHEEKHLFGFHCCLLVTSPSLHLSLSGYGSCLPVEGSGYPDQRYVGCKGDNIMESVDSVHSKLT